MFSTAPRRPWRAGWGGSSGTAIVVGGSVVAFRKPFPISRVLWNFIPPYFTGDMIMKLRLRKALAVATLAVAVVAVGSVFASSAQAQCGFRPRPFFPPPLPPPPVYRPIFIPPPLIGPCMPRPYGCRPHFPGGLHIH